VTVREDAGRLVVQPASLLTDEERTYIRANAAAIAAATRPSPAAPPPPPLLPSEYASLGLRVENGVVTHALGDEFAERILRGDISPEEARAMQQRRKRDLFAMRGGVRRLS
jgi:hypothetical protein